MMMASQGVAGKTISIKTSQPPYPELTKRLPWPRMADDEKTPIGVDIKIKQKDIIKIVYKYFRIPDISMDELLQEVFLAILHKNHGKSAHDPRKSSFGHYIYMIADNVCINLVHRKNRYDREKESIDAPSHENSRSLLDTFDIPIEDDENQKIDEKIKDFETFLRLNGKWDLARYLTMVRSGADTNLIREALSWGDRVITNKNMREFRMGIEKEFKNFSLIV